MPAALWSFSTPAISPKPSAASKASTRKIVKPPYSFPGGHRFHFADPDGYELAVWSDK